MRGCGLTLVRPPPFPGPRRLSQVGSPEQPTVFTIPAHRAFADALAAGLLAQHGGDRMALARGIILVPTNRSEEHTSELQSLMRISYAVFCLKKTKTQKTI